MRHLTERILLKTRPSWFKPRRVFEPYKPVTLPEIARIEETVGGELPGDLSDWLLRAGYGDVDDTLSFRYDWFTQIRHGHLQGAVIFAQDDLGNFYAYLPRDGSIVFFPRSRPEHAVIAPSFLGFMEELERRDFQLGEWVDSLSCSPYPQEA